MTITGSPSTMVFPASGDHPEREGDEGEQRPMVQRRERPIERLVRRDAGDGPEEPVMGSVDGRPVAAAHGGGAVAQDPVEQLEVELVVAGGGQRRGLRFEQGADLDRLDQQIQLVHADHGHESAPVRPQLHQTVAGQVAPG